MVRLAIIRKNVVIKRRNITIDDRRIMARRRSDEGSIIGVKYVI